MHSFFQPVACCIPKTGARILVICSTQQPNVLQYMRQGMRPELHFLMWTATFSEEDMHETESLLQNKYILFPSHVHLQSFLMWNLCHMTKKVWWSISGSVSLITWQWLDWYPPTEHHSSQIFCPNNLMVKNLCIWGRCTLIGYALIPSHSSSNFLIFWHSWCNKWLVAYHLKAGVCVS
jgi:hypothetical protein